MNELGLWPEISASDEPLDALASEPVVFGEAKSGTLTDHGAHQSNRNFAHLGARRMKAVIFGVGAVAVLLARLAALW